MDRFDKVDLLDWNRRVVQTLRGSEETVAGVIYLDASILPTSVADCSFIKQILVPNLLFRTVGVTDLSAPW